MSYIEDLSAITTPSLTDLLYIYQNGDDFKITNQQLLDLIKTNTVIPLTQAQYDALLPADKNNGAIYIITDASITADDVEYSSGVSVGDKLDSISQDITNLKYSTTGQLTKDNNVIGNVEVNNWGRKGNIVEFHITATLSSDLGNTTRLFSGLPIPLTTGRFMGLDTSSDKPFRVNLNSLGELNNWYTRSDSVPTNSHIIEIQGVYICQ